MARGVAYHLRFRSPLHIGERGLGEESVRDYVPADTLFGALCVMWAQLYGEPSLSDLLERYQTRGREPFFLTSAFPRAGDMRFYPKPLRSPSTDLERAKEWKSLQWLSEGTLEDYLFGRSLSEAQRIRGQSVLVRPDEYERLKGQFWDYTENDAILWRVSVVPRVTLDRISSAAQIWHFAELHFAQGCGLWFGVQFADPTVRVSFEGTLRLLGDTGLGGERGAGRGLFEFDAHEWSLPEPDAPSQFLTLAPWCPQPDQLAWLRKPNTAYSLALKRGWVGTPSLNSLRRREVWMVAEGSLIDHQPEFGLGALVEVQPSGALHPVYRYGYAFPVGVK